MNSIKPVSPGLSSKSNISTVSRLSIDLNHPYMNEPLPFEGNFTISSQKFSIDLITFIN